MFYIRPIKNDFDNGEIIEYSVSLALCTINDRNQELCKMLSF